MTTVNVADFRAFARDLQRAQPEIRRSMRAKLREAGNLVANEARALNISKQTKISVSLASKSVAVVAKGPIITDLEEGDGTPGTWRHPVFGNHDVWVPQKRHPYLTPALATAGEAAVDLIAQCMDDTFRVAGGA